MAKSNMFETGAQRQLFFQMEIMNFVQWGSDKQNLTLNTYYDPIIVGAYIVYDGL
jgi:hypothetical protein